MEIDIPFGASDSELINWECTIPEGCFAEIKDGKVIIKRKKEDYSGLTDLERAIHRGFLAAGVENVSRGIIEDTAKEVLIHAKAECHEDYLRGYVNGYKDAEKQYNESVAYHFPIMPTPPSGWGCDGIHCTNPHHDCINCPVKYSSGGTITAPNTASGISTGTLHGNTSATDGKEHNPSFTD